MMMQNLKINIAKQIARESKALAIWNYICLNSYSTSFRGYTIYKRNVSKNYWQFTIGNDITNCTFMMYEKEAKTNAKLGNE